LLTIDRIDFRLHSRQTDWIRHCEGDPLRRRCARGGVPGTAVRRRLPQLQGPRAPLAL